MLPVEQSAEDLSFIACERIEGFCGPFWSHLLTGDAIQSPDRVGWIVGVRQRGQVNPGFCRGNKKSRGMACNENKILVTTRISF